MHWQDVVTLAVAAITVIGGLIQSRRRQPRTRENVKQDLEILGLLVAGSAVKQRLQDHIDANIAKIIGDEDQRTRDPSGIVLGVIFEMVALGLFWFAIDKGGAWLWLMAAAFLIATLGAVGLAQDAVPRRRDARGRPL